MDYLFDNVWCPIALILILFAVLGYFAYQKELAWDAFAREHHCVVTGTIEAQPTYGVSTSGDGVMLTTPERHVYVCDGGYTVTR